MEEQNVYDSFRDSLQNMKSLSLLAEYVITYLKITFVSAYFFSLSSFLFRASTVLIDVYELIFVIPFLLSANVQGISSSQITHLISLQMRRLAIQFMMVYFYYILFKVVSYYTYSAVEEAYYYISRRMYWTPKSNKTRPPQDQPPAPSGSSFYPPFGAMREVPEE